MIACTTRFTYLLNSMMVQYPLFLSSLLGSVKSWIFLAAKNQTQKLIASTLVPNFWAIKYVIDWLTSSLILMISTSFQSWFLHFLSHTILYWKMIYWIKWTYDFTRFTVLDVVQNGWNSAGWSLPGLCRIRCDTLSMSWLKRQPILGLWTRGKLKKKKIFFWKSSKKCIAFRAKHWSTEAAGNV